jgi:nucleotide-binding universal stress UspA family protein
MSILVAINLSDPYEEILDQAVSLAKALSKKLVIIYVESIDPSLTVEGGGPLLHLSSIIAQRLDDDKKTLQALVKKVKAEGIHADFCLERGETARVIIDKARDLKVSMIVIGSHGHSILMDLLTGSTHEGVLHRADCPVLVVPLKD